jgi:predicted dehydrogenase
VNKLRAGVIGCGNMGRTHASAYRNLPGVDLVAVTDTSARRADLLCADFDVASLGLSDFLDSVDIVSICTWPTSHCELALEALRAGKHVLCEKPPAVNVKEAARMKELADENRLVLTYGLLYRHVFRDIVDVVRQVGRPYKITGKWLRLFGFPQWSSAGYRNSSGGAMTDLGVHVMDLAWYLIGCPEPTLVHAKAWNHKVRELHAEPPHTVDDSSYTFIQMENECSTITEVAYASDMMAEEHASIEIQGARGKLVLPVPTTQTTASPELWPRLYRFDGRMSTCATMRTGPRLIREALHDQLANFRDVVLGTGSPLITAGQAVTLQRMLDLAQWSARFGDPVTLDGGENRPPDVTPRPGQSSVHTNENRSSPCEHDASRAWRRPGRRAGGEPGVAVDRIDRDGRTR